MVIMQTETQFSFQRFMMLINMSLRINKKLIIITLAGVTGTLFLLLILFQLMVNFSNWNQSNYVITFFSIFLLTGILYTSQSFPAFRSKTKSLAYLMLPATYAEKFIFELITRIVLFILFMPVIYWIVANIEGTIVHRFYPDLINYKFSFIDIFKNFVKTEKPGYWGILAISQAIFFVFTSTFAGASHFTKSPLIKTLFTFSTIVIGYSIFSILLYKGMNLKDYQPYGNSIFMSKNHAVVLFAVAGVLINLTFLAIAWFRLKEKEA